MTSGNSVEDARPNRLPALRSLPAKGNSRIPSAIGAIRKVRFPPTVSDGLLSDTVGGNWIVKVTAVAAAPSATVVGVRLYVALVGSPLANRFTSVENVVAGDSGDTVKAKTAELPGVAVAEVLDALIVKFEPVTESALPLMVYTAAATGLLQ